MPKGGKRKMRHNADRVPANCSKENEEDDVSDNSGNMLGQYITKEYELLRLVLSYLPLRDLYTAAQVCTTWKAAVDVIRKSRVQLHWMFWHCRQKSALQEELPHQMFAKYFYSEPQLCLIFMTRVLSNYTVTCKNSKVPCPCGHGNNCNMSHKVMHYIRAELPGECPTVMIEGFGVVGSSYDLTSTVEVEEGYNGYSGVFVPKCPGVTVTIFHLTKTDVESIVKKVFLNGEEVENVIGLSDSSKPIRCLLLFCRDRHSSAIDIIVKSLENRQNERFALGGGLFDNVTTGCMRRRFHMIGIAFSGEGVSAASTVLGPSVLDKDHVNVALQEMRSHCPSVQESVGFMFACVGRGSEWYQDDNVEASSFCTHFPTTPLVGYFGNGEIGHKFLPVDGDTPRNGAVAEMFPGHPLGHSYSTVFVYVAFNRQE